MRINRFPVKSLLFSAALLCAGTVSAQSIDASGAERLKSIFTKFIEREQSYFSAADMQFSMEGDVVVEPMGSYYAVTMPNITFSDPEEGRGEFGMIAANVVPGEKDGEWKMAIAFPSPITYYDTEDKPVFTYDFGKQRFAGLWDENLESFSKIDFTYENAAANFVDAGITLALPKISMLSNMKEEQEGIYSGPLNLAVEGLNLRKEDQKFFSADKIDLTSSLQGMQAEAFMKYLETVDSVTAALEEGNTEELETVMAQKAPELFKAYAAILGEGFNSQYSVQNMNIVFPSKAEEPEQSIKIGQMGLGVDFKKTREAENADPKGQLNFRLGYADMDLPPPPEKYEGMDEAIPTSLNLDVSFNNLPTKEFSELLLQLSSGVIAQGNNTQLAAIQTMMALPYMLTKAQSGLTFNNTTVAFEGTKASLSGDIKANSTSKLSATADLFLQITNIDALISLSKAAAAKEGESKGPLADAYPVLLVLKGIGETSTGPDGDVISSYNIVIDETGKPSVNGTSLDMLMGSE